MQKRGPTDGVSTHILPNAATMVGICPTLIGLVKLSEASGVMRGVDEVLGIITVMFAISALASYAALRNPEHPGRARILERTADALFALALIGLAGASLLFAYEWL